MSLFIKNLMNFKKASVIGANGIMGAKIAGLIAGFGNLDVYMVARDIDKSKEGIEIAVKSVRSNTIRKKLIPTTYHEIHKVLSQSDWVIEAVPENYKIKNEINKIISSTKKEKRIISTITSGLSINKLAKSFNQEDRKNYFGIHFFNPPYKMLLCELIPSFFSDLNIMSKLSSYLENFLLRKVIISKDLPGFIANNIGFQLLNESAQFAEKYQDSGGIALIDELLNNYTGRPMSPLALIDNIGLDVYEAIVDNLFQNTNNSIKETFRLPSFLRKLIAEKKLGRKKGVGFYKYTHSKNKDEEKYVYDIKTQKYIPYPKFNFPFIKKIKNEIYYGDYHKGIEKLKNSKTKEAHIVKYFIARYISHSFSLVGKVTDSIDTIDRAMVFGFNWLPPSAFINLFGGTKKTVNLIKKYHFPISKSLLIYQKTKSDNYNLKNELNIYSLIKT